MPEGARLDAQGAAGSSVLDEVHDLASRLARSAATPLVSTLGLVDPALPRMDLLLALQVDAGPEEHDALAASLDGLRGEARDLGLRLRAAGHPLIAAGLDAESRRVDQVFGPLLVTIAALACAAFLRSLPLALVTMAPSVIGSLVLRAGLRALGVDANMILVAGAPLVFVLLVAAMLHLTLRFVRRCEAGERPVDAARGARRDTLSAALLAAATTAIGFGAFAASDVQAVRHLGLAVGSVVLVCVPLAYLVVPTALPGAVSMARVASERRRAPRFIRWRRLAVAAGRARGPVLVCAALGLVLGALAPLGMPVSTDALDYFPAHHTVRKEFLALEAEGAPLSSVDVFYRVPPRSQPDDDWAAALRARIEVLPDVAGTFGAADIRRHIAARLGADSTASGRSLTGSLAANLLVPAALRRAGRVDEAGEWARLTVRASGSDFATIDRLTTALKAEARRAEATLGSPTMPAATSGSPTMPAATSGSPTMPAATSGSPLVPAAGAPREVLVVSSLARLSDLQDALAGTLASSLGLTVCVVLLVFAVVLRGARERWAALIANLLPVALALLTVRALGYALDAATVMVASVVMGVAVDTTFHLLSASRAERQGAFARRRAVLVGVDKVGDAAFASALVLGLGFASLGLADFAPTARFGIACAIGVSAAYGAYLVVLPAILLGGPLRPVGHRRRSDLRKMA